MVEKLSPEQQIPALIEPIPAPLIFFDAAPNFGANFGVVSVTLAIMRFRPDGKGNVVTLPTAAADLRCNIAAAKNLREALDKAILLAEAKGEEN